MTTITVKITLDHVSGPEQADDILLDYFAGTIGEQNGALKQALHLTISDGWSNEEPSVYKVTLVDGPFA